MVIDPMITKVRQTGKLCHIVLKGTLHNISPKTELNSIYFIHKMTHVEKCL